MKINKEINIVIKCLKCNKYSEFNFIIKLGMDELKNILNYKFITIYCYNCRKYNKHKIVTAYVLKNNVFNVINECIKTD